MLGVLAAPIAEFGELQPFFYVFLVLGGSVILSFTAATDHCYNFLHKAPQNTLIPLLSDAMSKKTGGIQSHRNRARRDPALALNLPLGHEL